MKTIQKNLMAALFAASLSFNFGSLSVLQAQTQFLPTNYDEPYRGQFHFSQQSGWMNDVNGVWYLDGVYHLTYQSYPYSLDGNPKYWGHATSTDLVHWTQQPTILDPDINVPGACWSGSTVIDFDNTSGFGTKENPPLVTIYTATSKGTCLAYSLDKGFTWLPYAGNPVNVAGPNEQTRDPHVFWYEPTRRWVCVIFEDGFTFYNSPDLKTWTKTSSFGNGWGWECPDMFELAVDGGAAKKFVLLRADGQYYVGDFDGSTFTPDAGGPHLMTYNEGFGGGFYASQTFFQKNFPKGKTVQMAWMLGLETGSTAPWTHNATFPVEVKLKTFPEGIRVTRNPVEEIQTLYESMDVWRNKTLRAGQNLFAGKSSKTFDLEVVLNVAKTKASEVTFQFANRQIKYNLADNTLLGKPLKPVKNQVKIRFLVDWGELEIFGNDGAFSWTENFKFTPSDRSISMSANGDITIVSARLSNLKRIWEVKTTEINDLRVEYLKNPVGIDVPHPRFSWKMKSNERGAAQTAYEIVVSSNPSGKDVVWTSGQVASDKSVHIPYGGAALSPTTRYYWTVNVWNQQNEKLTSSEPAFFETGLMDSGWSNAQWLKYPELPVDGIPQFRTEFTLNKAIRKARIYSSALGVYDLFINGKRVGTPVRGKVIYDELKPGSTDFHKTVFYTTYDVTDWVKQGANALGAQVSSGWWNGDIAHGEFGNGALGFIAKLVVEYADGTSTVVVTDPKTWKTSTDSPVRMGDIYHGETYDARKESNWASAGFDDLTWLPAAINTDFKGAIKAFTAPPVQVRPELERKPVSITKYDGVKATATAHGMVNVTETKNGPAAMKLRKGETLVYDFGQNMVGWVHFKVKGAAGSALKIRFAEMLNDDGDAARGNDGPGGSLYRISLRSAKTTLQYTLKGEAKGEEFHPSTTFFGFRYCDVTATQDVEIESLVGQVVGTVAQEGSSFSTSDASVNRLYSNVMWGQRGNFLSVPTDCPQRDERLGWTGDIQIFSRAATYNADLSSFFQKWMGDMRDSQHENGAYPNVAPYSWNVGFGAAAWAEAGLVIPWNTYLMYGNTDILSENYTSMEKYMAYLANQKGDGFLYNGPATTYGDWVAYVPTDHRYISVCYYAYAALLMEKISNTLNKEQKAAAYKTLYDNIKAEFQTRYVNADGTLKVNTQTAHLLALRMGLFPDEAARTKGIAQLNQLIADNGDRLNTGFVGTGILNQTLSDAGLVNTAYNLLQQRKNPSWLYSVDQGATTIWERWNSYTKDNGFGDIGMNSFNHYAYGAVSEWMFRYMAGINVDESNPGFKHIIITPMPDFRPTRPAGQEQITTVNAVYNSYYGEVKSAWNIDSKGNVKYNVTIPANTTATLALPSGSDGKAEKIIYELQSGSYQFEVK
ncbi:hypothetical protein AGMMS49965_14550 [Bacteroidia bacterium]|nr:hypothetical protein AGMMS49965_14550 [Bacteroidia bacterium]